MDLHHEIMILLLQGELHKTPMLVNPQNILDVGTGTGIWAIDMADKYPSAEVLGIDLSPLQPKWCVSMTRPFPISWRIPASLPSD
jgi:cyclopropane fatty-acyl-phospholipid synthase-like methyltransferase